jgi:hypothetical protein
MIPAHHTFAQVFLRPGANEDDKREEISFCNECAAVNNRLRAELTRSRNQVPSSVFLFDHQECKNHRSVWPCTAFAVCRPIGQDADFPAKETLGKRLCYTI